MSAAWADRLVEVWASPHKAGTGVVVGSDGVLTARHVIGDALAGGRILARVVRPNQQVGTWVPMTVRWNSAEWDLALLAVDRSASEAAGWLSPGSPVVALAALGLSAEDGCEAVGFPDAVVQPAAHGRPSQDVRQSEQVVGRLLPVGQGKPPQAPDRDLPVEWMPLDAGTVTPATGAGWQGMSGAPAVLPPPDGRLVGAVVAAETSQPGRLYVVPIAAAVARADGLADEMGALAGAPVVVSARHAPAYRAVLQEASLGPDGMPCSVEAVDNLGAFGIKPADLPGEPTYLDYVPRDDDVRLRESLLEAVTCQRVLLVVGGSAAGKSRSAADAVRAELPQRRLLRPKFGRLEHLAGLALTELDPAVVWLDDVDRYAHRGLGETLRELLDSGLAVVATIRRAQLDVLAEPGDLRDPAGEALSNDELVLRIDWQLAWSDQERARLIEHVHHPGLLAAAAAGTSPSVYSVAGPELLRHVRDAQTAEEWPWRYPLIRAVLDWFRTGVRTGLPLALAPELMAAVADTHESLPDDEFDDACAYATRPVFGGGRKTRQSVLTRIEGKEPRFDVHDYVLDHDQRTNRATIPRSVWDNALANTSDASERIRIGTMAHVLDRIDVAADTFTALAAAGDSYGETLLAVLLATQRYSPELDEARAWYEQAAQAGDPHAQNIMGVLLETQTDPPQMDEARAWYERAARVGYTAAHYNLGLLLTRLNPPELAEARRWCEPVAKAGHVGAQNNLGLLLTQLNPPELAEARRWFTAAAQAGYTGAQYNLGRLLSDILKPPELDEARSWFTAAAQAGDPDAQYHLALLLGRLDSPEPAEALQWLSAAAEKGHTRAQHDLGRLLATGLDLPAVAEAQRWLESAAQAGHVPSMEALRRLQNGEAP